MILGFTLAQIFIGGSIAIILLNFVAMIRAAIGPTMQDRVVAINMIGTSVVIIIALVSAGFDRPEFLEIALVYALLNFVLSIVVAKFTIDKGEVL